MAHREEQNVTRQSAGIASTDVEFDESTGTYRTRYDSRRRPVSEAVVEVVSTAADADPVELPPLYSVVDTDALNRLFTPTLTGGVTREGRLQFEFHGFHVTVYSSGIIEIESVSPGNRR